MSVVALFRRTIFIFLGKKPVTNVQKRFNLCVLTLHALPHHYPRIHQSFYIFVHNKDYQNMATLSHFLALGGILKLWKRITEISINRQECRCDGRPTPIAMLTKC